MDYRLNLGAWRKVFAVPACVADDNHLKLASGTQIKVLLYLLAYPDMGIRGDMIAQAVGVSPEDVDDAVLYWTNAGVLTNSGTEYYPGNEEHRSRPAPVPVPVPVPAPLPSPEPESMSTPEVRAALSKDTHFPPKAIAGAINSDNAVKYLFTTYERLAGRPPKHAEQQTLMVLVEEIGLPCEITMMLVEYCFTIDKATPAYMKAVARDWCDNGIDSIGKAEERIKLLTTRHTAENRIRSKFGITTSLSQKQKKMIEEWSDLAIPDALIDEAYDLTMTNTGKLSFPYMDKILRAWHSDGITEPSQIPKAKKPGGSSGGTDNSGAPAPSYNVDEVELESYDIYKDL